MKTSLQISAFLGLALCAALAPSTSQAALCQIVNNAPGSVGMHASPSLDLSAPTSFGAHRFVTLSSGAQIEVEIVADTGSRVIYEAVDPRQPVHVTVVKVGGVERQATVTIGNALPLDYSCSTTSF